eukprot:symbB.v1.2.034733.t1/scaffold4534.1/size38374/1
MGSPTIKDIVELNKAVKMLKESAEFRWTFRPSTLNLENAVIFVCSDSSFANLDGHKSQCGYVVGLTSPEIQEGLPVPILVLETISSSIRRVWRSTLAAEANAFLTGYEAANYLASLLREVMHPAVSLRTLETEFAKKKVFAFTDAKSLESTINKDAGQPSDKRVRILVAQVKEMMREVGNHVIWVDTSQMLADVLTKIGCERELLLQALEQGTWQLLPSAEALRYQITGIAKRTSIADGNTWNHEHIATLGRTLTSSEKKAHNAIRHLADYVLVWAGGGGDDLAKSPHLARIGNSVFPDHCGDDDPKCNKFSFYADYSPTPMMARSLLYKLCQHKVSPGVTVNEKLFKEVHTTKHGLMRVYQVMNVSQESKDWVADPKNRICDAPGSWYCVGQYPPALEKLIAKRKNFAQIEDFNKQGGKSAYTKLIEKELHGSEL